MHFALIGLWFGKKSKQGQREGRGGGHYEILPTDGNQFIAVRLANNNSNNRLANSNLHWPWLFWEILRDSYLYLCNGQWSLSSFLQNKYSKLTPSYIINTFILATPCKQVWVNRRTCYVTYYWLYCYPILHIPVP